MTDNEIKTKSAELKRTYIREWRAKNKDKVAAANRRYWERKAAAAMAETEGKNDN